MFSRSLIPSYALKEAALPVSTVEEIVPIVTEPRGTPEGAIMQEEMEIIIEREEFAIEAVEEERVMLDDLDDTENLAPAVDEVESEQVRELRRKKSRSDMVANALFPVNTAGPSTSKHPRHSLPLQPTKKQVRPDRKSLSPRHAATREVGTLLALPLAAQFATLKKRNASLEKQVTTLSAAHQGGLFRAASRIATLEKSLEGQEELRNERDGWESEATRLAAEMSAIATTPREMVIDTRAVTSLESELVEVQKQLAKVSEKTKKYKDVNEKLRLELESRRVKEKWDLGIMDVEDRKAEMRTVALEFEISQLRATVGINEIDQEAFEETVEGLQATIKTLGAARTILLNSYNTSQATVAGNRTELITLRKDVAKERATAHTLEQELTRSREALNSSKRELAQAIERSEELEAEVDRMESEAAGEGEAEQKKLKVEGKELARLRKSLDEEKSKREIAEAESKTLKATLKSAQSELKLSEKSLVAANRTAELANKAAEIAQSTLIAAASLSTASAASLPVVKASKPKVVEAKVAALPVKATRRRKSMLADMSIEEEEMNSSFVVTEDEEEESMDTSIMVAEEEVSLIKAVAPVKPVKAKKAPVIAKVKKVAAVVAVASDSDEDDGSVYRAVKAVPRAASATPAPAPRAISVAPVVVPVKKAKATKPKVMLGDKSTNAKAAKKSAAGGAIAPKGKGKRDLSVLVEATEGESMAVSEPAKKKKKSLFLGPKKFEWAKVIENADVNSLGLPSALSPVKLLTDGKRTSLGTMGRGLSGGRKSIFS